MKLGSLGTRRKVVTAIASGVVLAMGCSLVNSLDDVQALKRPDGTYGFEQSDSGVVVPDAGVDTGVAPPVPDGVIAVSGEVESSDGTRQDVFTALDPATGRELSSLSREKMVVSAIRYDGLRDLWFVFESSGYHVPGERDTVTLHVRTLDRASGAWAEQSKITVPTLVFYGGVVVLRDRISYVAYRPRTDAGVAYDLVTLDTSNPASVTVMPNPYGIGTSVPAGVIGTRSTAGAGGTVNLAFTSSSVCTPPPGGRCPTKVSFQPVLVPNAGSPVPQALRDVPDYTALPGSAIVFGSVVCSGPQDLVVYPSADDAGASLMVRFDPLTGMVNPQTTPFSMSPTTGTGLHAPAVDESRRIVFVVETNTDLNLTAVPLTPGGTVARAPLGHSGQAVYYEPFTQTALAPFNQGSGHTFSAYRVGGTATQPTLTARQSDWSPPSGLRPHTLDVRRPLPTTCP